MKLYLIFLLLATNQFCNKISTDPKPEGIPADAKLEKRTSLYIWSKNGTEKQWTIEGTLYSECKPGDGNFSTCKTYFKDGSISSEGNLVNGDKDGLWKWYFPDGKLYVYQFHDHSKKRIYWMSTHKIGNEHGEYKRYYSTGSLELEGWYDSGYKTGLWKKYYKDGSTEYIGNFSKDKKIGEWKYFHPNKNIYSLEKYTEESSLIERKLFNVDGTERKI